MPFVFGGIGKYKNTCGYCGKQYMTISRNTRSNYIPCCSSQKCTYERNKVYRARHQSKEKKQKRAVYMI